MKKRFLPLSMLLITMVLAQASLVANATGDQGKYNPRKGSEATFSSFMKSIRANQETGLIDPALIIAGRKAANSSAKSDGDWTYAGPDNFGGVARAVIYKDDETVMIGTIGGEIYQSTNNGITFGKIASLDAEFYCPISCMAKDNNGNIYIGTGDGRGTETYGYGDLGNGANFMGNGVYKMDKNGNIKHLSATNPAITRGWEYVNEITIANNKIYAATKGGIMVSEDKGETWNNILAGEFRSVKSNSNGDILAADDSRVYLSKAGNVFDTIPELSTGAANTNLKIIAMSPSDPNIMYIAYLTYANNVYSTNSIYFTYDGGTTWVTAVAQTNMYAIFGEAANYDGFMIVHPTNPRKVFIGSDDLWILENNDTNPLTINNPNSYEPKQVSSNNTYEYSAIAWNRYYYLHQGIQNIAFCPTNPNVFFIGTVGGVYKGLFKEGLYSYSSCNRYFETDELHTSTTRMMSVAVGGQTKLLGGCLDHGTIKVEADPNLNSVTTGTAVFPNPDPQSNANQQFGFFTKTYAGGPCAISTIKPSIIFVSGTGSLSVPIHRSETDGEDYDDTNFSSQGVISNSSAYKTPFALHENYMNELHTGVTLQTESGTEFISFDTLNYSVKDTMAVGTPIIYYSTHGGYPFRTVAPELPDSLQNDDHKVGDEYVWLPNDTIRNLHDSINSTFVFGVKNKVYMTRMSLVFNKATEWLQLASFSGSVIPSAVTISADGDEAWVGTLDGKLYKFPYLNEIFVKEQLVTTDAANYIYNGVTFLITEFQGQAVTSISVDPNDNDHVIVTLGNYGEGFKHVYVTNNGNDFTAVQGTGLPEVPVYSSLIEKTSQKDIYVGTELGMYVSSNNGANWTKSGVFTTPVMDIKQAIEPNHADRKVIKTDEAGNQTEDLYPGVNNEGMMYAATFGTGLLVNSTYYEAAPATEPADDDPVVTVTTLNVYPNPVKDNAQINIKLDNDASVSYVIYDFAGRQVINNELGAYTQGTHTLNINTANLSKGSYIIRIKAGEKNESAKFLVY